MAFGLSHSKACGLLVPRQGTEPTSPCNALVHQGSPLVRMTFCDLWADAGLRVDRLGASGASALLESPLCLGHIDCLCWEGSVGSHIMPRITMMWATSSGVCLPMTCPARDNEAFCADETRMGKAWYVRRGREMGRRGWLFVAQSCLTPWITALQALLSMELSWQEYWNGLAWRGIICCKYVQSQSQGHLLCPGPVTWSAPLDARCTAFPLTVRPSPSPLPPWKHTCPLLAGLTPTHLPGLCFIIRQLLHETDNKV